MNLLLFPSSSEHDAEIVMLSPLLFLSPRRTREGETGFALSLSLFASPTFSRVSSRDRTEEEKERRGRGEGSRVKEGREKAPVGGAGKTTQAEGRFIKRSLSSSSV